MPVCTHPKWENRRYTQQKMELQIFRSFYAVVLQRSREVKNASSIKCLLSNWIDALEARAFGMLKEDKEQAALAQLVLVTQVCGVQTPEQRANMYARLLLQGKLQAGGRGWSSSQTTWIQRQMSTSWTYLCQAPRCQSARLLSSWGLWHSPQSCQDRRLRQKQWQLSGSAGPGETHKTGKVRIRYTGGHGSQSDVLYHFFCVFRYGYIWIDQEQGCQPVCWMFGDAT
jgi:hypothetical protein